MGLTEELSHERLAAVMPGRPMRFYRAILSTEADALAWARADAPEGALVAAGYQLAPRGRAGTAWEADPASSVLFSLILRPSWPAEREGWLYALTTCALADVVGAAGAIEWPDQVVVNGSRAAAVGIQTGLEEKGISWAVVNVLIDECDPPHPPVVARAVDAIERRYRAPSEHVLRDYVPRCRTLGERVRARLIPLGPGGPEIAGTAVAALADGALSIETERGNRVAVRPQNLGVLERTE